LDDPNPILPGLLDKDGRHAAGDTRRKQHAADIDSKRTEVLDGGRAEEIVSHARHHRHIRAAKPGGDGLVGAFAAESQPELPSEAGLAWTREIVGVCDQVDIRASNYDNLGCMAHRIRTS